MTFAQCSFTRQQEREKVKRILAVLLVYFGVFGTTHPVVAGEVTDAEEKALAELVEAAKAGNPEAQYHIGHALTYQETDANTFSTGIIYLERAAEQGHVLAMHTLAFFFRPGKVPGKTATDAFNWYRRAAEAGLAGSQNNLGDMYETGEGVSKSFGDAIHWYTRSAMQGEPTAYLSLAECYTKGIGVGRDVVEAYRWWLLAVKNFKNAPNNRAKAVTEMQDLEKTMTPQQIAAGLKLADKFVPLKQTTLTIGDPQRDK